VCVVVVVGGYNHLPHPLDLPVLTSHVSVTLTQSGSLNCAKMANSSHSFMLYGKLPTIKSQNITVEEYKIEDTGV
jgi:hypothetical protein